MSLCRLLIFGKKIHKFYINIFSGYRNYFYFSMDLPQIRRSPPSQPFPSPEAFVGWMHYSVCSAAFRTDTHRSSSSDLAPLGHPAPPFCRLWRHFPRRGNHPPGRRQGRCRAGAAGVVSKSERSESTGSPAAIQPPPLRGAPCEGARGSSCPAVQ